MPLDALPYSIPATIAALALLAFLSMADLRTRRVPQHVSLPALALLGTWRLWRGDWIVFACWLGALGLWLLHLYGAGDAKVLMIELALWPSPDFILTLGVTAAALGAAVCLARDRSLIRLLRSTGVAGLRLLSGHPPDALDLKRDGAPQVFLYAAGAFVYVAVLVLTGASYGR